MKKNTVKVLSAVAALSLAVSCGKDSGSGSSSSGTGGDTRQAQEPAPLDGSNIQGHYQAKFVTMNPHVNGTIPGSANFFRKEQRIFAYVRLFAGGVRAWHMQHVYTGGRCPTMKDDKNGDGFIDINEAEKVLGKILIPLDSNISSQASGRRFFPLADLSGYYHYERITNFNTFLRDLQEEDKDPTDDLVKLGPDQGLRIEGKTVLIQGVTETVDLPETVGSKGRFRAFQTLPIACGVFKKMPDKEPGSPYVMDRIPGPIADVVEGQDRPAEEPIPDTTTGGSTSGSTGGGSNESDDGDGPVSDGEGRTTGSSTGRPDDYGDDDDRPRTTTGGTSGGGTTDGGTTGGTTTGGSTDDSSETSGSGSGTTGGSSTGSTTTSTSSSSSSSSTTGGAFGF